MLFSAFLGAFFVASTFWSLSRQVLFLDNALINDHQIAEFTQWKNEGAPISNNDNTHHSGFPNSSIRFHSFFLQTLTPLTIQLIPYLLNIYSLGTKSFDPSNRIRFFTFIALESDINNSFTCVQLTHTFYHTAILVLTTPSYREACAL